MQKEGQSFDHFLAELKKAVKTCEYKEEDEMIRDRVVLGIKDKTTQERLLREERLDLTKAIAFCRITEISKVQSQVLQNENVSEISIRKPTCKYCGYTHNKQGKCPAYGKTCAKCQRKNHFAKVCNNELAVNRTPEPPQERYGGKKSQVRRRAKKNVHELNIV